MERDKILVKIETIIFSIARVVELTLVLLVVAAPISLIGLDILLLGELADSLSDIENRPLRIWGALLFGMIVNIMLPYLYFRFRNNSELAEDGSQISNSENSILLFLKVSAGAIQVLIFGLIFYDSFIILASIDGDWLNSWIYIRDADGNLIPDEAEGGFLMQWAHDGIGFKTVVLNIVNWGCGIAVDLTIGFIVGQLIHEGGMNKIKSQIKKVVADEPKNENEEGVIYVEEVDDEKVSDNLDTTANETQINILRVLSTKHTNIQVVKALTILKNKDEEAEQKVVFLSRWACSYLNILENGSHPTKEQIVSIGKNFEDIYKNYADHLTQVASLVYHAEDTTHIPQREIEKNYSKIANSLLESPSASRNSKVKKLKAETSRKFVVTIIKLLLLQKEISRILV